MAWPGNASATIQRLRVRSKGANRTSLFDIKDGLPADKTLAVCRQGPGTD